MSNPSPPNHTFSFWEFNFKPVNIQKHLRQSVAVCDIWGAYMHLWCRFYIVTSHCCSFPGWSSLQQPALSLVFLDGIYCFSSQQCWVNTFPNCMHFKLFTFFLARAAHESVSPSKTLLLWSLYYFFTVRASSGSGHSFVIFSCGGHRNLFIISWILLDIIYSLNIARGTTDPGYRVYNLRWRNFH